MLRLAPQVKYLQKIGSFSKFIVLHTKEDLEKGRKLKKQARKGFRPISASQIFLGSL